VAIHQLRRMLSDHASESVPASLEHVEPPGWRAAAG
jgi:hypothetical protein